MKIQRTIPFIVTLLLTALILGGCLFPKGPVEVIVPPRQDQQQPKHDNQDVAKRFTEQDNTQNKAEKESAVQLSEKYAKLAEELIDLRQRNKDLASENTNLTNQIANSQAKLAQTEKELKEATDLLIDMQIELNNWKSDVIGFREEMRNAEKAQLDALMKIYAVLGGEIVADPNESLEQGFSNVPDNDSNLQANAGTAKSNE